MKRILKIFSFVFMVLAGLIFGTSKVNAVATRGDIISGKYVSGPYYVMHEKPSGGHMWLQAQFIIRTSDGQFVYCVQPYFTIKEDNTYNVTTEDILSVVNISQENWDKIAKVAYYGYGYKDSNYDHTADKWYIAAQMLIWKLADPSIDSYFTNTLKGTRNDNILKAEMDEIMSLVNNHLVRPAFDNLPSTMNIGQTITINDTKNVLNRFELNNVQNGIVTKNGNSLSITATGVGTLSFSLSKMCNIYGDPIQLYYAVDSQNVMKRGDLDPIRISKNITVYGGDITIHKTDSETIENKPQGEGRLDGAVYGIYREDGTKVGTITTNSEGYSKSDYLPSLGRFYVLEEKPSIGYELDKNKYYFDVTPENLHPDIQVFEQVIRRKFEITKVYASAETKIMIPEVGVKFGIYNNKGILLKELTTDEQGNFEFSLPYGTYTVKQLTTTKGHEKMKDFNIEVTSKGNTIKKVISNAEITAKLKVIKIDSETKEVIKRSGIKFKILDTKTNEYVCQTITYPNKKTVCEFETDENGEFTTAYPLQSGTYKLEEIDQKIDGYLWNKESKEFTIDENSKLVEDKEYGIIFETTFGNTSVKGKVEIKKLGEVAKLEEGKGYTYTNEILSGIEFGLYQNDKLITKGITDEKGELVFSNLKLGNYCVIELKTKDGYILNDKPQCFELKYKDQYTPGVTYKTTINNRLNTSKFEFTKADYSTDETLPNTTIKIYTINDELVYEGKTDSEGKIVIDRLPIGKYYIEESEAPEGYLINDEKMYFEVKGEEIVKSTMKDEKITGTSTKKRPNFMRMLKDAEKGCFDLIITREVSRFARNTVDALQETRNLKKMGVEVYFTEDHIWTMNDEDGELRLTIMATLAQNESRKTSQRVKAGQKISFENGVIYGTGNILGYDKVGKDFIVNEEQAKTVRLMFERYLKGDGLLKIKYELESRGYLTSTGKKIWEVSAISRTLKNSFYCGIIEYRKYYVPDYLEQKKKKNNGEIEKIYTQGKHEPLISVDDFNKVQELLISKQIQLTDQKNKSLGKKDYVTIWGKKLECKCGSRFNKVKYSKIKDGSVTYAYRCYHQIKTGSIGTRLKKGLSIEGICDNPLIPEWKMEIMSKVIFEKLWNDKEQIIAITNNLLNISIKNNDNSELLSELEDNNRRIELIENKLNNVLDAFISEIITKDNYIKKKQELDDQIMKIKNRNKEIEEKTKSPETSKIDKLRIIKKTILESLNFDNENISNELVDNLIEKITVYGNRFVWKLKMNNNESSDNESVLLASVVISKDRIKKMLSHMNKKLLNYDTIYVDIYI